MMSFATLPIFQAVATAPIDDPNWGLWFGLKLLQVLGFVIVLALLVAALVLADRKIWAAVQMRKGPNGVGVFGLLQSFADFLKYIVKEIVVPAGADKAVFFIAPMQTKSVVATTRRAKVVFFIAHMQTKSDVFIAHMQTKNGVFIAHMQTKSGVFHRTHANKKLCFSSHTCKQFEMSRNSSTHLCCFFPRLQQLVQTSKCHVVVFLPGYAGSAC